MACRAQLLGKRPMLYLDARARGVSMMTLLFIKAGVGLVRCGVGCRGAAALTLCTPAAAAGHRRLPAQHVGGIQVAGEVKGKDFPAVQHCGRACRWVRRKGVRSGAACLTTQCACVRPQRCGRRRPGLRRQTRTASTFLRWHCCWCVRGGCGLRRRRTHRVARCAAAALGAAHPAASAAQSTVPACHGCRQVRSVPLLVDPGLR